MLDVVIELTGLSEEDIERVRVSLPAGATITIRKTDPSLAAAISRFPSAWARYEKATSPAYYFHRSAIMSNWGRRIPADVHALFRDALALRAKHTTNDHLPESGAPAPNDR